MTEHVERAIAHHPTLSGVADMAQLILVSSWAAEIFPDWKPHPNTLRNWVHNGKIRTAPKKIGNKYFCDPKSEYVDPIADKIERTTHGS
jgi:hypothetical protein